MLVHVNDEIVREEDAKISIFDHGYMYGLGAFETLRIYDGHPFLFYDHMERLQQSLNQLDINVRENWKEQMLRDVRLLLKANELNNAYVRINISAGIGTLGLQVAPYENPTKIIYVKPLPEVQKNKQEKQLQLLKIRRNTPEGNVRIKSHHFLNNVLGKREVGENPEIEGFFLSEKGFVAEGVVSNLFWVKDGIVYTPAITTGILAGITRKYVISMLNKRQIPLNIGEFSLHEIENCDEAFLTNSIQEIVPVKSIGERMLSSNREIPNMLNESYMKHRRTLWSTNDI